MQDARLALLERGGSVPNPDAWVRKVARALDAKAARRRLLEAGAWFEREGMSYPPLTRMRQANAEAERRRVGSTGPKLPRYVTDTARQAARRKSWRESKQRARALDKEPKCPTH